MSLDIWSRDDIKNALLAADSANRTALAVGEGIDGVTDRKDLAVSGAYRRGYVDALTTLATAFGIPVVKTEIERPKFRERLDR